ncbi:hypothetical protein [Alteromonas sp. BMJM2]|uniref:hypothetical protein n=1 Tax=Alteromonas sp. BMJM2 TaxID=2954241 RepID=UPI0022B3998C|nr:hypothetical protein [Alteromonas sp. BMJM2]
MKIYCLTIGISLLVGSAILLLHRIQFIYRAKTVSAVVAEKIFRNASTETRLSKAMVLKLNFYHPTSGATSYVCDTSVLTPFFDINDQLKLSILGNKVLLKHWFYVILAPTALLTLGILCIIVWYQL